MGNLDPMFDPDNRPSPSHDWSYTAKQWIGPLPGSRDPDRGKYFETLEKQALAKDIRKRVPKKLRPNEINAFSMTNDEGDVMIPESSVRGCGPGCNTITKTGSFTHGSGNCCTGE